jgi:hypothetical protein
MTQMKYILGMFLIAAILFAQSGCAAIAGHLAVAGGKKVYEKVREDRAKNEEDDQG